MNSRRVARVARVRARIRAARLHPVLTRVPRRYTRVPPRDTGVPPRDTGVPPRDTTRWPARGAAALAELATAAVATRVVDTLAGTHTRGTAEIRVVTIPARGPSRTLIPARGHAGCAM